MPGDLARRSPLCMYINRCAERVHSSPCTGIRLYLHIKSFLVLYKGRCSHFHETTRRVHEFLEKSRIGLTKLQYYSLPCQTSNALRRAEEAREEGEGGITLTDSIILLIFRHRLKFCISFFFLFRWLYAKQALLILSIEDSILYFWQVWWVKSNTAEYWKAFIYGEPEGGSGLGRRSKIRDKELIAAFGNGPA